MSHVFSFFFFNDTATTEIYTLSLHDALPIPGRAGRGAGPNRHYRGQLGGLGRFRQARDRKSTRLNSCHVAISYAGFCLKKKKRSKELQENRERKERWKEKNKRRKSK